MKGSLSLSVLKNVMASKIITSRKPKIWTSWEGPKYMKKDMNASLLSTGGMTIQKPGKELWAVWGLFARFHQLYIHGTGSGGHRTEKRGPLSA